MIKILGFLCVKNIMNCRLCGSESLYLFYQQGNNGQYHFYRCKSCRLVNYDLRGGLDQKKYTYTFVDPSLHLHKQYKGQKKTFEFIARHIPQPGTLLDIGCGNGSLLLVARDHGWKVTGMELSEMYASELQKRYGINIITANFLSYIPDKEESYDLVTLRHVLEHLPDPVLAMQKINALLREGGIALLEFPNIDGAEARFKRFLEKSRLHKRKYQDDYFPGHCHEFSEKPFRLLCDMTGFQVVLWETYSSKTTFNWLNRLLKTGSKARALIQKRSAPV